MCRSLRFPRSLAPPWKEIADSFRVDAGQSSYYRKAAEALGLVTKDTGRSALPMSGDTLPTFPLRKENSSWFAL